MDVQSKSEGSSGTELASVPSAPPNGIMSLPTSALGDASHGSLQTSSIQQQLLSAGSNQCSSADASASADRTKTNVIVNYLPQTMSQEEFRSLFASMGEVKSCKLVRDKITGQSLGYGFVNYIRAEDAQKAVTTLNGLRLQTKLIKVSFARPSSENIKGANLYVSGLPKTMKQSDLEQLFTPYGRIITSRILCDPMTGLSKGVGFVRFDKKEEAEMAITKLNGFTPLGATEPIVVKFANNPTTNTQKSVLQAASALVPLALLNATAQAQAQARRFPGPIHHAAATNRFRYSPLGSDLLTSSLLSAAAASASTVPPQSPQGISLFVYNLPPDVEDATLWQLFGPFGAVLSVKVIRDFQTHKCKGYGFVTMLNYDDAVGAVTSLHGKMLGSRVLQVSFKSVSTRKQPQ